MNGRRPLSGSEEKDRRPAVLLLAGLLLWIWSLLGAYVGPGTPGGSSPVLARLAEREMKTDLSPHLRPFLFLPLSVNRADAALLQTIPGIGPDLSERIIRLRKERQGFACLDELLEVDGIGEKKLAVIKGHCTL